MRDYACVKIHSNTLLVSELYFVNNNQLYYIGGQGVLILIPENMSSDSMIQPLGYIMIFARVINEGGPFRTVGALLYSLYQAWGLELFLVVKKTHDIFMQLSTLRFEGKKYLNKQATAPQIENNSTLRLTTMSTLKTYITTYSCFLVSGVGFYFVLYQV